MLTVISFPPGLRLIGLTAFETILPQGIPARLWRRGLYPASNSSWRDCLRLNLLESPCWKIRGGSLRADLRPTPSLGCPLG